MEKCSICQQKLAAVICLCQNVHLCYEHLPMHLQETSGTHITFPVDVYANMQHAVAPFIETNRDSFKQCSKFLKHERARLAELDKYKIDLKSKIEQVKVQMWAALDNLFESKALHVRNLYNIVEENMIKFKEKGEIIAKTERFKYDLESSIERYIEDFISSIGYLYDISNQSKQKIPLPPIPEFIDRQATTAKSLETSPATNAKSLETSPATNAKSRETSPQKSITTVTTTSEQWVWSNQLKGDNISICGEGKSINMTERGRQGGVMVDVPMSEGKYSWKIKLNHAQTSANYRIGVAEKSIDLDQSFIARSFWGFNPGYAYKFIKGFAPVNWGKKATEGDIIEITLEFVDNQGILSFSVNGESLGVLARNLKPPLYPAAQIYFNESQTHYHVNVPENPNISWDQLSLNISKRPSVNDPYPGQKETEDLVG